MLKKIQIQPGKKPNLKKTSTDETFGLEKEPSKIRLQEATQQIAELQKLLYAEGQRSILIVLQGLDTSGKDGTTRAALGPVNPQGVRVWSFKRPTEEELSRDFLWRIHQHTPAKGMINVFNRSHYEDVLVPPVEGWINKKQTARRYEHINAFESLLSDSGTTVLKFYLHISKEQQKERLLARLDEPTKNWKFEAGDLATRKKFDDYLKAYETLIEATSTQHAPWHVVPGDRKWLRNLTVAETLLHTLEKMSPKPPKANIDIAAMRAAVEAS